MYSICVMSRGFQDKFQDVTVPNRKTVHTIVNKLRQKGAKSKCQVLTEEKFGE
jgi:hypothetical protein